mmetsp:Transcript_11528/g.34570  ORF Transcript_11528/g.34570 Transcript_11528/m.34570 type:complete len:131 (+) Transcript_11528:33-425(+)
MVTCSEEACGGAACRGRGGAGLTLDEVRARSRRGQLCKGCCTYTSLLSGAPPPPHAHYPLRNKDHRFEWTRAEFRAWAEGLAAEHGYSVRFDGVGGGAWDEERQPGAPCHGPGPSSQVAIFERPGMREQM